MTSRLCYLKKDLKLLISRHGNLNSNFKVWLVGFVVSKGLINIHRSFRRDLKVWLTNFEVSEKREEYLLNCEGTIYLLVKIKTVSYESS